MVKLILFIDLPSTLDCQQTSLDPSLIPLWNALRSQHYTWTELLRIGHHYTTWQLWLSEEWKQTSVYSQTISRTSSTVIAILL